MKALKIFLVLAFLGSVSFGYTFWMAVQFYDTPTAWASCTLGVQPGATDSFDFGIDMFALPPLFTFGASFVGGAIDLSKDIRSDTDTFIIWRADFQNYTAPSIGAHWLSAWAPSDSVRQLYIGYGTVLDSTIDWVVMNTVDSLVIPVGNSAFFKLVQDVEEPGADSIPPVISNWFPEDGDSVASGSTMVYFDATDETELDSSLFAVHLWIDTLDVGIMTTRMPIVDGIRVQYTPIFPFAAGSFVTAIAQVQDKATPPNIARDTITFYVEGGGPGDSLLTLTVQTMLVGFPSPPLALTKVEVVELARSEMTDDMGIAVFDSVPADTYTVVASRIDFFSAGTTIVMNRDTMIYLILMEDTTGGGGGNSIDGTVSLGSASDLSGSILSLMPLLGDSTERLDTTDTAGHYAFTGLTPGMFKLIATHEGYAPDSALPMIFFSDTTIDFDLGSGGPIDHDLLVIDWDNGDVIMPWGIGPAEWFFGLIPPTVDAGITVQDPDIAALDLSGLRAVAVITGNRLGTNATIDDSSLQALIDFVEGGGSIYFEGPDIAENYGEGSLVAREFFALFGVGFGAEGFSASTGNIERIVLARNFHPIAFADTIDYPFRTEADHFVDELLVSDGDAIAYSVGGPTPAVSPLRASFYGVGASARIISCFFLAAADSGEARQAYIDEVLYHLLEWTDIPEAKKPTDISLIDVEPNPFNSSCRITAPRPVEIYDLSGRLVANHSGDGSIWRAMDSGGRELPSGTFLVVLRDASGRIIEGRNISLVR